jgi:hypothetical protein
MSHLYIYLKHKACTMKFKAFSKINIPLGVIVLNVATKGLPYLEYASILRHDGI